MVASRSQWIACSPMRSSGVGRPLNWVVRRHWRAIVAFDAKLVERVRGEIGNRLGLSEKPMFGCAAFFVNGNLGCGVRGKELLIRIDPSSSASASKEPGVRPFRVSGRLMKGWLLVDPTKVGSGKAFSKWVSRGMEYASSLPKK